MDKVNTQLLLLLLLLLLLILLLLIGRRKTICLIKPISADNKLHSDLLLTSNQNGGYIKISNLVLNISTLGAVTISWGKAFQSFMTLCEKTVSSSCCVKSLLVKFKSVWSSRVGDDSKKINFISHNEVHSGTAVERAR